MSFSAKENSARKPAHICNANDEWEVPIPQWARMSPDLLTVRGGLIPAVGRI